jgi:hypothetical protein
MNSMRRNKVPGFALPGILAMALMAMLAGCERGEQTTRSAERQAQDNQPAADELPLGQVEEFDGFTLRANVSPTESLPEAMARQYGIESGPNLALLNLVILEARPDQQPVPVPAELNVQYESLIGHAQVIDMREAEADGYVSYIGTLDASTQRIFRIAIEAQPAGADEPLRMHFEVQLDTLQTQ